MLAKKKDAEQREPINGLLPNAMQPVPSKKLLSFENSVRENVSKMMEGKFFGVLTFSEKERAILSGSKGVGVLMADDFLVEFKKENISVLASHYSHAGSIISKIPPATTPKELAEHAELDYPPISAVFRALSSDKRKVTLSIHYPLDFKKTAENIFLRNWFSEQEEKPLVRKLLKSKELMKEKMVDERLDGITLVGMGSAASVCIPNTALIKMRPRTCVILLEPHFSSSIRAHVGVKKEFLTLEKHAYEDRIALKYPQLLEDDKRFSQYLAIIAAFRISSRAEVHFGILDHEPAYHLAQLRLRCRIPKTFMEQLHAGMSFDDVIEKTIAEGIKQYDLTKSFRYLGMTEEANRIQGYLGSKKNPLAKMEDLLDDWVRRGLPSSKDELLKQTESMTDPAKQLGTILSTLQASNERDMRRK